MEDCHHLTGDFAIVVVIPVDKDGVGATPIGLAGGHRRMDTIDPRLIGSGGDHSAFIWRSAHDDGFATPFGVVALLDRREKRIHVNMKNIQSGKR